MAMQVDTVGEVDEGFDISMAMLEDESDTAATTTTTTKDGGDIDRDDDDVGQCFVCGCCRP